MNFWKTAKEKKPKKAKEKKQGFSKDSKDLPDNIEFPFELLTLGKKTATLEEWIRIFETLEIFIVRENGKCVSRCVREGFGHMDLDVFHPDPEEALKMCLKGTYENLSQLLLLHTGEALPPLT